MKKFFSILCALAIVLGVNAAPISKQARMEKAQRACVENLRTQKVPAKAKKAVTFQSLDSKKVVKQALTKHVGKTAAIKPAAQIARAPQAKQDEAIKLNVNLAAKKYYADTKDVWYAFQSTDGDYQFFFDILLPEGQEDVELGVHYTFADMDGSYSYGKDFVNSAYIIYAEADFVYTKDLEGEDLYLATITDENGQVYELTTAAPEVEPGEFEIECASAAFEFYSEDNDAYYLLTDSAGTCQLFFDIVVAEGLTDVELGKTYTLDDMIEDYSNVIYDKVMGAWKEATFTKTVDEEGLAHISGVATDEFDRKFTFSYAEQPAAPGDTIEHAFATCASLSYSAYFEDWVIEAADEEFTMHLDILSDNAESPAGEYTTEDFDINYNYVKVGTTKTLAQEAFAIIVESNDSIFIAAELLCEDGNTYRFSAFWGAPTKQGEETIEANNLVIDASWYAYFGVIFIEASNEEHEVALNLYNETAVGTFEFGEDLTGEIDDIAIYSGEITITADKHLTGKVLCYDNIEYTLDLIYVKPEKTREVEFVADGATLTTYFDESGDWFLAGFNNDSTYFVQLDVFTDKIAGEYTEADMDDYYTAIMAVEFDEEEGKYVATEQFDPIEFSIVVTFNAEDSTAVITGKYLGQGHLDDTDVPEFTLNIKAQCQKYEEEPQDDCTEYDAEEGDDFIVNFAEFEIDDTYLEQYGVLFISAQSADNEYISLELWLPEGATELVAGEYPVSAEEEVPQTVTAGELDLSVGKIYGSFAGNLTAQGISVPLWLLIDGTVTIAENSITVDAVNCAGAKIQCKLGGAQGIDNVDADKVATKSIKNGQLIIRKNGVDYNAQGAIVK